MLTAAAAHYQNFFSHIIHLPVFDLPAYAGIL